MSECKQCKLESTCMFQSKILLDYSTTAVQGEFNCQALVPSLVPFDLNPNPKQSQIQIQVQLGLGWQNNHIGHHPNHPTHHKLLTMNEWSREKVLKVKKSQNNPPYPSRWSVGPGGQWDQEHGVVLHVQREEEMKPWLYKDIGTYCHFSIVKP